MCVFAKNLSQKGGNCRSHTHASLTFHSHPGLAEVAASSVAGFAQVIPCVGLWDRADLQTGRPTNKRDSGVSAGFQLPPVLQPLDGHRRRAANMTLETQLLSLVNRHWLQWNIELWQLASFWLSEKNSYRDFPTVIWRTECTSCKNLSPVTWTSHLHRPTDKDLNPKKQKCWPPPPPP